MHERSGLKHIDPPGVGAGEASFHLEFSISNPNAFALRVVGVDGAFFLAGRRVAAGRFSADAEVKAGGQSIVGVAIKVPLSPDIWRETFSGSPDSAAIDYRLVGQPLLDYFGLEQRLPEAEVFAAGRFQPPEPSAPRFSLLSDKSAVSERSAEHAVIDIVLLIENLGPHGYTLTVPDLHLLLSGEVVGEPQVLTVSLPSFSRLERTLRFEVATSSLNLITANELRRLRGAKDHVATSLQGSLILELGRQNGLALPSALLSSGFLP